MCWDGSQFTDSPLDQVLYSQVHKLSWHWVEDVRVNKVLHLRNGLLEPGYPGPNSNSAILLVFDFGQVILTHLRLSILLYIMNVMVLLVA